VYGSPNNAALFLGACIGLVMGIVGVGGLDRRRAVYASAGLLMLCAGALTQSMGFVLLGFPAALATVLMLRLGRRALPILAGLALMAALLFIPLARFLPRMAHVTDLSSGTTFIRRLVWQGTVNMIREHPVTGVGPDQFLYQYRSRYILPAGWTEPNLSHAHNYFLDHWARLGIVGLALAVGMQTVFWRTAWRVWRARQGGAVLVAGFMGAMACFMAHGLVDTPFFVVDLNYIYALMLALTATLEHTDTLSPNGAASNAARVRQKG